MTDDYEYCTKELKANLGILLAMRALNGDDFMAITKILTGAMERIKGETVKNERNKI
jgi:hypothetical protein